MDRREAVGIAAVNIPLCWCWHKTLPKICLVGDNISNSWFAEFPYSSKIAKNISETEICQRKTPDMTKDHDSRKPVSSVESGFDFLDRFRFPTGFARKFGACSVFSFFPRREFYGSWRHQYGAPCRTPRFFAKLKIEPPNFFRQCFFFNNNFCTPDYFVETKNVGHHRERDDRCTSHISQQYSSALQYWERVPLHGYSTVR